MCIVAREWHRDDRGSADIYRNYGALQSSHVNILAGSCSCQAASVNYYVV